MNLILNKSLGNKYSNKSQKIRVITENWVLSQIYCPNCGNNVYEYANNMPVADFCCKRCSEDFELKSKKGKIGKKVSAGAYSQMIKRINSPQKPNFFFMGYMVKMWSVNDFFVVPKHFFVSEIIEQRKPLTESARRAGWVGSNILFSRIPKAGQIFYIENGKELNKRNVLEKWKKTVFLKKVKKVDTKGWILDIMNCIDSLNKKDFTLKDMYAFENDLFVIHPENKNIKAKIRQQLQFLRNKDYLEFVGNGTYKLK
ncbi:MAG: DpnI domain-containing protein [Candidatus Paceibacterota bacterium]|jgi:type II restriction enzyme